MRKYTPETPAEPLAEKPAAPSNTKRVRLKNTRAANGIVGAIATPLEKDAAAWRAIGWVNAD